MSLGCVKNLVDSEKMLGQIAEAGCHITADEAHADVIVINTCGFLGAAREEAVGMVNWAIDLKRTGRVRRVVMAGCLVQRDGELLADRIDGVDALVGVNNRNDIVRAVMEAHDEVDLYLGDYYPRADDDTARLRVTPPHYAYLRISEGCNQKCTFCTIPAIRGPMHSKPPDAIIAEARELVSDGAVEINLIGQDTTSYGRDLPDQPRLPELLRRLDRVDGVTWLRLMYAYPTVFTDEMIDAIAECNRVVKYVDLPLQHINDRVLKAMGRRVDRRATEDLLERIRRRIPGLSIRTTMIAGFPGETEALKFAELCDFVRAFKFDALGVFAYSQESDTPAGRMNEQVPEEVKEQRVEELMLAQQDVAFELADAQVGRTFDVLIEGLPVDGLIPARHQGQAPEVDSRTWVQSDAMCKALTGGAIQPGELVSVRCTGRRDYDLLAVPAETPSQRPKT